MLLVVRRCRFGPGGSVQPSIHPELVSMLIGFSAASAAPSFRNGCVCESGLAVSVRTERAANPEQRSTFTAAAKVTTWI